MLQRTRCSTVLGVIQPPFIQPPFRIGFHLFSSDPVQDHLVKPPLLALMKQTAGVVWFHGQPWSTIDCTFGSFGLLFFFCQRLTAVIFIAPFPDATILPPWLGFTTCHLPQNSRQNGIILLPPWLWVHVPPTTKQPTERRNPFFAFKFNFFFVLPFVTCNFRFFLKKNDINTLCANRFSSSCGSICARTLCTNSHRWTYWVHSQGTNWPR